jgi:hypothetical protein
LGVFGFRAYQNFGSELAYVFLSPDIRLSLIFSIILLPLLFLVLRIVMLFRGTDSPPQKVGTFVTSGAALFIACFSLVIVAFRNPFAGTEIPVDAETIIDATTSQQKVNIQTAQAKGNPVLFLEKEKIPLDLSKYPNWIGVNTNEKYEINYKKNIFLSRKNIEITIQGPAADTFSLSLLEQEGEGIYDCNFPYLSEAGIGMTQIFIGAYPSFPLHIEMTVPENFSGVLVLNSRTLLPNVEISKPYKIRNFTCKIQQRNSIE